MIHAAVIVYIFAHLHTSLHTAEGNMLDVNIEARQLE